MDVVALGLAKSYAKAQAAAAGVALRTAMFVGGGQNGTGSFTNMLQRIPITLPVTTTSWRLRFNNRDKYGVPLTQTGAIQLQDVAIGEHAIGSDGLGTGNFTAAPTVLTTGNNGTWDTPADGAEYVGPWITAPPAQFTAQKRHLLSAGLVIPAGTTISRTANRVWFRSGVSFNSDQQTVTSLTAGGDAFGDVRIEYTYLGQEPVLFVGDSITDSLGTAQEAGYPNTFALRSGQPAIALSVSGIQASQVAAQPTVNHYWTRVTAAGVPKAAVVWLGTNDLSTRTDTQIKADLLTIYGMLRSLGVQRLYGATIAPRQDGTVGETARVAVNTWLRTRPAGLIDVFEYDQALLEPGTTASLNPLYDYGDDLHLNTAGLARIARAIPGRI